MLINNFFNKIHLCPKGHSFLLVFMIKFEKEAEDLFKV